MNLIVSASSVIGMAQAPEYGWMRSLEPIRAIVRSSQGCRSCGSKQPVIGGTPNVSQDLYQSVVTSQQFQSEIKRAQTLLGMTGVEIFTTTGVVTL